MTKQPTNLSDKSMYHKAISPQIPYALGSFFLSFFLLRRRNIFPRFQNVHRKTRTFNFRSLPAVACSFLMTHRYIILEMNEKIKQQPKYSYWYYLPNVWESVVCVSLFCELHEINHKTVLEFTAYTSIYFGLLLWRLPIC